MSNDVLDLDDEPAVAAPPTRWALVESDYRRRIKDLERQRDQAELDRETFLGHIRDLHYRNDLLQQRLDQSIGREARTAADALDTTTMATTPVRGPFLDKQEQAQIAVATYRAAMHGIGKPATAQEIARFLGYSRMRVYNWLNVTGRKHGVVKTTDEDNGFHGKLPVRFSWPSDTKEAS